MDKEAGAMLFLAKDEPDLPKECISRAEDGSMPF
jgi:hypothetical protein